MKNPRLQRLKESLTPYSFTLGWKKGKEHKIPDALSRSPVEKGTKEDEVAEKEMEQHVQLIITANIGLITNHNSYCQDILIERLQKQSSIDNEYKLLKDTICNGFPTNHNEVNPIVRPYCKIKDYLSVSDDLVLYGQRLIVPKKLRQEVLQQLHSSHQGIERTRRRARQSVYWPGIDNDIKNVVASCRKCQQLLPSQQREPLMTEPEPAYPFQSVSADYFSYAGKQYLIYVDRKSGWPMVKMYNQDATAKKLITTLRKFFSATGVPELLRSDNGPQFVATEFRKFLSEWGVRINPSSPYYPQSNGHAEATVKSIKNLIIKSTENGSLDTDQFAIGLLELRNTPKADGLSPAQVLFGHPIRSLLPVAPNMYKEKWMKVYQTEKREENKKKTEIWYNRKAKPLVELSTGSKVLVQDHRTGRWATMGTIIEVGENRQYLIKKQNGSIIWRNRRFIRKYQPVMPYRFSKKPPNQSNPTSVSPPQVYPKSPVKTPQSNPNRCSKFTLKSPQPSPEALTTTDLTTYRKPMSPSAKPVKSLNSPHNLTFPKINPDKIKNAPFQLPKSFFDKLPSQSGARARKPPDRLQVSHKNKRY